MDAGILIDGNTGRRVKRRRLIHRRNPNEGRHLSGIVAFQTRGINGCRGEIIGCAIEQVGDGHRGVGASRNGIGVCRAGGAVINVIVGDSIRPGIRVPGQGNRAGGKRSQRGQGDKNTQENDGESYTPHPIRTYCKQHTLPRLTHKRCQPIDGQAPESRLSDRQRHSTWNMPYAESWLTRAFPSVYRSPRPASRGDSMPGDSANRPPFAAARLKAFQTACLGKEQIEAPERPPCRGARDQNVPGLRPKEV